MDKKTKIIMGLMFIVAACLFAAGTVNHLVNTGEGTVSSVLLALGCVCAAFFCLRGE